MNYADMDDSSKKQFIYNLYISKNMSFQDIANKINTYANKIRRDAIKFDIPIRDKSMAQKNALVTGKHKHPTKGKKRSDDTKNKIGLSMMKVWTDLTDSELKKRQNQAKKQWNKLSDDEKNNMIHKANMAVRQSSKTGSKLEKFLLDGLIKHGYRVDFHKEQILSNTKLQIDLFLPKLNVAIEVDGPSHYLPVWGDDSLLRNIKYDQKKTGLLLGKGCVLIRIKQLKDFSKTRANQILSELMTHLQNISNKFPDNHNRTILIGE
jgi:very-short-patch-repair endonuclease